MPACVIDFGVNDVLQFDIEKAIAPELPLEVSEYPIEDGAVFADSMIRRPRVWTVTALVSNTPLTDTLNPRLANGQTRVSAVWSRLVQARQLRQTCSYTDDLDTADVCAITNVVANRDSTNQNALELTVTFREIFVATAQRAKVRALPSRGARKKNGTVPTFQQASDAVLAGLKTWDQNAIVTPTAGIGPQNMDGVQMLSGQSQVNVAPSVPLAGGDTTTLGANLW